MIQFLFFRYILHNLCIIDRPQHQKTAAADTDVAKSNLYTVSAVRLLFLLSGISRMQSSSGDWAN